MPNVGSTATLGVLKLPLNMPVSSASFSSRRLASHFAALETLPDELRQEVLLRFTALLRVFCVLHVIGIVANVVGPGAFGWSPGCSHLGVAEHVLGLALTVAFLVALRRSKNSDRLLNYGLGYQVLTCFIAAFAEQATAHSGISIVAVLILVFPLFVPREPRFALLAGFLSASVAPLAFILYRQASESHPGHGLPLADPWTNDMLSQFGVNFLFACLAVIPSKVMARMTRMTRDARKMGAYELIEKLGEGGMGEVWRAQHSLLRRPAAIKLIRQNTLDGQSPERALQRFEREAQATAELESPHSVQLFDFGAAQDGTLFYVMELLNGIDLETYVKRFGPMPPERVAFILSQVCDSLDDAHERGLVHRDIKPANILICKKGRRRDFAKVVDFGLVRPTLQDAGDANLSQTSEGQIRGTPAYLSPEAITGDSAVDTRSDLYALGCVAYYLLTAKLVFAEESPVKMAIAHAVKEAPPVQDESSMPVPTWLADLITALLNKNPDQRPQSALAVRAALQGHLERPWTEERALAWWNDNLQSIEQRPNINCEHPNRDTRCCEIRLGELATSQA